MLYQVDSTQKNCLVIKTLNSSDSFRIKINVAIYCGVIFCIGFSIFMLLFVTFDLNFLSNRYVVSVSIRQMEIYMVPIITYNLHSATSCVIKIQFCSEKLYLFRFGGGDTPTVPYIKFETFHTLRAMEFFC